MIELVEYVADDGQSPFGNWFEDIDTAAALRVRRALVRMEQGNFGDSKAVRAGVMEYRITFGPGYRIYYAREGETVIVRLGGGTKKRQWSDIETAKSHWADYQAQKGRE
ncbi:MAG: type II toxin-antitoxin system RelE/ParE family toxin [Pseudomonadota bacterium]